MIGAHGADHISHSSPHHQRFPKTAKQSAGRQSLKRLQNSACLDLSPVPKNWQAEDVIRGHIAVSDSQLHMNPRPDPWRGEEWVHQV